MQLPLHVGVLDHGQGEGQPVQVPVDVGVLEHAQRQGEPVQAPVVVGVLEHAQRQGEPELGEPRAGSISVLLTILKMRKSISIKIGIQICLIEIKLRIKKYEFVLLIGAFVGPVPIIAPAVETMIAIRVSVLEATETLFLTYLKNVNLKK